MHRRIPGRVALLAALACVTTLWVAPQAMAAAIVVNSTAATVDDDGACTLTEAIAAASQNQQVPGALPGDCASGHPSPVTDTIRFEIFGPASPSSPHVISIGAAGLPPITEKVFIDGTTEPDYANSPVIEIQEASAPAKAGALWIVGALASGSTVTGLAISAASGSAIAIENADDNTITANHLGSRADGSPGSVAGSGVTVVGSGNLIGGGGLGNANLIAGNGGDGVSVEGFNSIDNAVLSNSILANGADPDDLAIDLDVTENPATAPFDGDGRSPNDSDDSDPGANGAQNHPEITGAVSSLSLIQGELDSKPSLGYRIEVFASPSAGPGDHGIAQRLIGHTIAVTGANGHADWGLIASPGAFTAGEWITATATPQDQQARPFGTSELSQPAQADLCTIEGTEGNDTLTGTEANDTICAFGGDDVVDGAGGDDFVLGGDGNDTLRGGAGHDAMFGEDGLDTADYSQVSSNVNATLAGGEAIQDGQGSRDSLSSFEALVGGPVADILAGDNLDNPIDGRGGDDIMNAAGGVDTVSGGLGDDAINGGDGPDRLFGGEAEDIISGGNEADEISGGGANDSLDGGAGNDVIKGEEGADTLAGQQGADVMIGSLDRDRLEGGGAADLLSGGPGTDRIDGDRGNDGLEGEGGNDKLNGGQGKDRVSGGVGNDRLGGSSQSDRIRGGKGNDLLNGGGGTDKLFGDDDRDRFIGGAGKNLCDGGKGRDLKPAEGCVTIRSIP